MRSLQVTSLEGPSSVQVTEVEEPAAGPDQVVVEVKAVGVSWPDLLQTRGEYQIKPELPFQLGVDFAGDVVTAPPGSGFEPGDRVACCLPYGGGADLVAVHQAVDIRHERSDLVLAAVLSVIAADSTFPEVRTVTTRKKMGRTNRRWTRVPLSDLARSRFTVTGKSTWDYETGEVRRPVRRFDA